MNTGIFRGISANARGTDLPDDTVTNSRAQARMGACHTNLVLVNDFMCKITLQLYKDDNGSLGQSVSTKFWKMRTLRKNEAFEVTIEEASALMDPIYWLLIFKCDPSAALRRSELQFDAKIRIDRNLEGRILLNRFYKAQRKEFSKKKVLARDGTRAALNPVVGQGDFKLIKTRQHTRSTEKKKPLMMIEDIKLFLKAMMIQDFNTMEAVGEWLRVTFEPRKYAPSGHFFKVGDEVKVRTAGGDWIRGEVVNATSSNTFDVEVGEVDENGEPLVDENGHRHAAFLDVLAHPKFMRHSKVSDVFTWNDDHQTYIRRSINVSVRPLFSFWRRLWHTHFKSIAEAQSDKPEIDMEYFTDGEDHLPRLNPKWGSPFERYVENQYYIKNMRSQDMHAICDTKPELKERLWEICGPDAICPAGFLETNGINAIGNLQVLEQPFMVIFHIENMNKRIGFTLDDSEAIKKILETNGTKGAELFDSLQADLSKISIIQKNVNGLLALLSEMRTIMRACDGCTFVNHPDIIHYFDLKLAKIRVRTTRREYRKHYDYLEREPGEICGFRFYQRYLPTGFDWTLEDGRGNPVVHRRTLVNGSKKYKPWSEIKLLKFEYSIAVYLGQNYGDIVEKAGNERIKKAMEFTRASVEKQEILSFRFHQRIYLNDSLTGSFKELKKALKYHEPFMFHQIFLETFGLRGITQFYRDFSQLKLVNNQWWVMFLIKSFLFFNAISPSMYPENNVRQSRIKTFRLRNPLQENLSYSLNFPPANYRKCINELIENIKEMKEEGFPVFKDAGRKLALQGEAFLLQLQQFVGSYGLEQKIERWNLLARFQKQGDNIFKMEDELCVGVDRLNKTNSQLVADSMEDEKEKCTSELIFESTDRKYGANEMASRKSLLSMAVMSASPRENLKEQLKESLEQDPEDDPTDEYDDESDDLGNAVEILV